MTYTKPDLPPTHTIPLHFHFPKGKGKSRLLQIKTTVVVRQVCGVFGNLKKNENMGQLRQCRTHCNFQPYPQDTSETKVIVVFLLQLGKV